MVTCLSNFWQCEYPVALQWVTVLIPLYRLPTSRFVVQDLPEVIPVTLRNMAERAPLALKEGRIQAEAVDLFGQQRRCGEKHVYLLRHILCVCGLALYLSRDCD